MNQTALRLGGGKGIHFIVKTSSSEMTLDAFHD